MKVKLGFRSLDIPVDGEPLTGGEEVLCKIEDDLTRRRRWHDRGYTIKKFFSEGVFVQFHEGMQELFIKCMRRAGMDVPWDFNIKNYHELIKNDTELHQKVLQYTSRVQHFELPVHISSFEERVSEILSIPVECRASAPVDKTFAFKIVLPGQAETSPIHRDAWKESNKGAINIYVPLTIGPRTSSISIAPGSHLWPECELVRTKDGALVNGIKCDYPGVLESKKTIKIKRPSTGLNKVMVYSSYLLNGGITNQNKTSTHVSMEMRFWRKQFLR